MWRIPRPIAARLSTCPPFFSPWKLTTFSQCKTRSSLQSRDYLFYCLWCQHVKTPRLRDRWTDADETWHLYSINLGTKLPGSEILNFGPCAAPKPPLTEPGRQRWPTPIGLLISIHKPAIVSTDGVFDTLMPVNVISVPRYCGHGYADAPRANCVESNECCGAAKRWTNLHYIQVSSYFNVSYVIINTSTLLQYT